MQGYQEIRALSVGISIQEWLEELLCMPSALPLIGRGHIFSVHQRSLILQPEPHTPRTPEFLIIGLSSLESGPLFIALPSDAMASFQSHSFHTGQPFHLFRRRIQQRCPSNSSVYRLQIGPALDVHMEVLPQPSNLGSFQIREGIWCPARGETLDRMWEDIQIAGHMDGLGWLRAHPFPPDSPGAQGHTIINEIHGFLNALHYSENCIPETLGLLGRGPGATPSGDDVLAGLLLVLHHGLPESLQAIGTQLGTHVAEGAHTRTNALSRAFLNQARRGRAAESLFHILRTIIFPTQETPTHELIDRAASIGHTSGIDTLIGMFLGWRLLLWQEGNRRFHCEEAGPR